MADTSVEDVGVALTKKLTDEGKVIEAGFVAFASLVIPQGVSPQQVYDMKMSFMAGAEHAWSSILCMLDEDQDPTEADLRRMDKIQKELDTWRATLALAAKKVAGNT